MPKIITYPRPVRAKLGTWTELEFTAETTVDGLTWLLTDFSAKHDHRYSREDWVLAVPGASISVSRYVTPGEPPARWGEFARLEDAMRAVVLSHRDSLSYALDETAAKLRRQTITLRMLDEATQAIQEATYGP